MKKYVKPSNSKYLRNRGTLSKNRTNRDHAKKTQRPMVEDEVIAKQPEALVTPAITAQENYYHQLKLRNRILNLPFIVAAVLTLLWRDTPGVTELIRILGRECFFWCKPLAVSQQAISNDFLKFPAELFKKIFKDLLPHFKSNWHSRNREIPEFSFQVSYKTKLTTVTQA